MAGIVSDGDIRRFYGENRFALQSEHRLIANEPEVCAEIYIADIRILRFENEQALNKEKCSSWFKEPVLKAGEG